MKAKSVSFTYKYKKMGDIQVGDSIVGPSGEKFKVIETTDHGEQDVYKIILSDGRFFESMLSHLNTVHFRNSHVRPDKKVYDTVTTGYIMDNLDKYVFEIPTDDTFDWSELDYPQFLEMLPLHEYEPIDKEFIIPDLRKDPKKVYIEKIEKTRREKCKCISVGYPWGLYLVEDGILTHNSLLTNLCMAYEIALFSMMREPFKILGHSQPVYEKVKLPNGKYTTIGDLKIGMKIAGVTCKESEVLDIIEQGQKDTYELEFENGLSCRCSMDHLWTVFDSKEDKYVVLPLKSIIEDQERYCFPEEEDCIKDRAKILEAEITFSGA